MPWAFQKASVNNRVDGGVEVLPGGEGAPGRQVGPAVELHGLAGPLLGIELAVLYPAGLAAQKMGIQAVCLAVEQLLLPAQEVGHRGGQAGPVQGDLRGCGPCLFRRRGSALRRRMSGGLRLRRRLGGRWGGGPGGAACQHQDGQGKGKGQFVDLLHVHHLYPIYKRNGKNVTQSGNFPRTGASQLSSNMP